MSDFLNKTAISRALEKAENRKTSKELLAERKQEFDPSTAETLPLPKAKKTKLLFKRRK